LRIGANSSLTRRLFNHVEHGLNVPGSRLDEALASGGDYLDDEERERLHESLREGIRQMKAGQTVDAAVALAELRAHR
jgi:hypothetical protein